MTSTSEMRRRARDIFQAAVDAAEPARALRRAMAEHRLPGLDRGQYRVIALGKAACAMIEEGLRHLPAGTRFQALAVTNSENARTLPNCTTLVAGHPVPDEGGLRAGQAVIEMIRPATAHDHVIALISGGGSALLPAPVAGVSLQDKAEVSRILLGAGFDITGMNMVRQQLSTLKGGGMARLASPALLTAYILSDVIGDDLRVIASGPTAAPIATRREALSLLKDRDVFDRLPASVKSYLSADQPERTRLDAAVSNTLIGSNRQSLNAALAAATGFSAKIVSDRLIGDVSAVAAEVFAAAQAAAADTASALLFGGETTVTLTGDGKGGRNQELALRFALLAGDAPLPGNWVFLSGGTDGRDGPTDAAGGLVDQGSIERIRAAGKDPQALLANNDSYRALKSAGDLLITGATGTNVADIQIFLAGSHRSGSSGA